MEEAAGSRGRRMERRVRHEQPDPLTDASPAPSRTGSGLPSVAINPRNGQLYVVWPDPRLNDGLNDESLITASGDGGAKWSAAEMVSPRGCHSSGKDSTAVYAATANTG
jgi:hypothetical protein